MGTGWASFYLLNVEESNSYNSRYIRTAWV